ncbi:hypothetical protein, partial [Synechococcus sp. CS-1328]|uniref:hypothetical protein n=1 Tax=Synechococcus sp. CS-1328 TaxID=2847976 RepID=UPI00223B04FD
MDLEVTPGEESLSGTTSPDAVSVVVVITGSDGSTITIPADKVTINPDGTWTADLGGQTFDQEVDYTAEAVATDAEGLTGTGNTDDTYNLPPTVTVDLEVDPGAESLSGTTSPDAVSVSVVITGSDGSTITIPADQVTINPDGTWTADLGGQTFDQEVDY